MSQHPAPDRAKTEQWNRILKPYWGADTRRSVTQIFTSIIPYAALWYAMLRSLEVGYWLTLLLAFPAAGFLMRLFMIQHDCGHGSFFKSRAARDWVGRVIGVLLLTPYDYWRRTHAYHHAHSGDLDFRDFGDIDTHTVREYLSWSWFGRLRYRLYRNPFVMFVLGPIWVFGMKHRFPWDVPREWKHAWRGIWWTNVAIVGGVVLAGTLVGYQRFLAVQVPIQFIASSVGIWMFYVQHQFEHTYWHRQEEWDFYDAALHGASYLVLPRPIQWLTSSIGVHHVHHMSARIPNYRLQQVHEENPEFHEVTKVRFRDTLGLVRLTLWDEDNNRLIGFRDLRRVTAA